MDPRFARAYGALAGLALGDALGMPTQAMSPAQIRAVYGRITGLVDGDASQPYAPGMPAGSVTDDTEQALLIASLLVRGRGTSSGRVALGAVEFSHALLAWEDSMIRRGSLDLLGPSTKAALERVRAGEDPLTVGGEGTTNGAAMRVTPIGIAMPTADPEAFADSVWSSCQVTHATRQGFQSAALVAAAVSLGIDTARSTSPNLRGLLWKAVTYVDSLPERGAWTPDPDVVAATRRAMQLAANPALSSLECLVEQVGTSVASAQAIPMAFALLARDPSPQALLDAANLGGDTDTIGAIAGAILGAALGVEVLPTDSLSRIEEVSHLGLPTVARELLELRDQALAGRQEEAPTDASSAADPDADTPPEEPATASSPTSPAGRVVVMSELMLRFDRRTKDERIPTGAEWSTREGVHLARPFPAMRAARSMGVAVLSLSPIGNGPRASIIAEALEHEGIIDAGPRIARCDSGFASPVTTQAGGYKNARITGMPEDAWDEAVRTLDPSDVLYIDASIEDNPSVLAAAEHALAHLPRRVRIVLDVSGAFIGPRALPNNNVLMVLDQGSVRRLGERFMSDRTAFDASRVPDHAASFILSLFNRSTLVSTMTYESFLARLTHTRDKAREQNSRFQAPTVASTDHDGAYSVWTGALAAALAQGNAIERSIVLANCAGALASTMPGPASCPTHEEIEAAARALTAREDIELERRTHAFGALAGVAFGDAIGMPARGMPTDLDQNPYHKLPLLTDAPPSHPTMPGASAGTLTAVTLEVLASSSALLSESGSPLRAEDEDRTAHELAGSRYVLHAIPVGIATVTTDPEAFAQAVWQSCGNENLTVQEFQAAALVAAAISLAIDKKHYWVSGIGTILNEAINYVAALPTRGSASSEPDVLQATRKAIGIVHHFGDGMYERLRESIGTSTDPTQSVPTAFGLILKYESEYAAVSATILGGETSLIAAIASAVLGAIRGVTMFSPDNLATIERVSHPGVAPLSERLIERREHICDEASGGGSLYTKPTDDTASD